MVREQVRSRCRCRVFRANIVNVSTLRLMISGLFLPNESTRQERVHPSVFVSWRDTCYLRPDCGKNNIIVSREMDEVVTDETTSASDPSSHCVTFGRSSEKRLCARFKVVATATSYDERQDEFMHKS